MTEKEKKKQPRKKKPQTLYRQRTEVAKRTLSSRDAAQKNR
jgi:hypothetical protein